MSTEIQSVPPVILASPFPSLADRPAGLWNQKAKSWADSENAMAQRQHDIATVTYNNALFARAAADEAVPAAITAVAARDKALEYRDSAQAAAAAAGSGAGLPSLVGNAGKALVVGPDEDAVAFEFATPTLGMRHITAAHTITEADQALMLRCSGTFTLSFAPLANMPTGWFCYVKNAGDGDITLDPSGSEQIDGRTSYIMYPGECRLIAHNGTEFVSVVLNGFYKVFTVSGDFIKPPGYRLFEGWLWGAGGGGAKHSSTDQVVRGGMGGACSYFVFPASELLDSETVAIGAGGIGATMNAANGGLGGVSIFKNIESGGGNGGEFGLSWIARQGPHAYRNISGLNPAFAGAGMLTGDGGYQSGGFYGGTGFVNTAESSIYGAPNGGYISAGSAPANASRTIFGPQQVLPSATGTVDGNAPGGGGAPTRTGARAGNGARGEMRIRGVI